MLCAILRTHMAKDCSSPQIVISGCEPIVIQIGQDVQSLEDRPQVTVSSLAPHCLMEIET